ncbi:M20/M25/M40 family metallo-hydrolase [Gymnodinialimonas ceratoperidinii]|uniref:M20/M25/M40 family metallo-hydrolase n=1 Tax=Gymnodinialimonas ceratoperidinii TaxID=2856823 RepID=A0A8F6TYG8_9RHOB|nr:M20/M25/M40 family metallo-hydrolase [Gymnodinialimonas ceratoperidinii]QXT40274.1 M20/M25/M40 family metallo-hydrolase [Gymnodinialimonas ceratoperidinii]
MSDMKEIYDYIDAHADEFIADLQEFVQQPSISAQDIGLRDCAALIRDQMHRDGLPAEFHELEEGPPVVYGEVPSKSKKTLLCYSHYDVQPPEPIEAWSHGGPWSGAVVDGVLYGRGATDNKSGVLAFNKAAKAFLAVRGEVPVGLKLLIEGEEEIGSPNLGPWAKKNAKMLEADGMHCLDGSLEVGVEVPDVSLGLKSILFVELVARGPRTDVHSLNAPLVPNPVWDLVHALATIMDRNKNILIPDWAEGIYEPNEEDMGYLEDKAARIDFDKLRAEVGVDEFALGRDGVDAIKARTYEPTANIQGITGGYTGKGTKTIVPAEARVRMDFRLIPNISPEKAMAKLKAHLKAQGFDNIEVKGEPRVEEPYKISAREDISQSIIAAAHEVYGEPPIVNGVSAEGAILKHVWIPCVLTGFANPGCNLHAPDENIHVDKYIQGIKYAAAIMEHFGRS